MTQNHTMSPLDKYRGQVENLLSQNKSYQEISDHLAEFGLVTTRHSIRRAVRRWGLSRPEASGARIQGDDAELTSKPHEGIQTQEELLQEFGLDPEEWEVYDTTVKKWNGMTSDKATGDNRIVTLKQIVLRCRRVKAASWVYPARIPGDYIAPPKLIVKPGSGVIRRIVFVGDQQAPYQDQNLHRLFCEWLEHNQPDEGVLIGDTLDFPDISRHNDNPEWHVSAQECIDSGYLMLREYVQSSDQTRWTKLIGNHDERIRTRLINYQTRLAGLRRAKVPGEQPEETVFHISNLLRLDELGIKVIDPRGNYDQAQYNLSPHLAAVHGWKVRQGAGASALATLDHCGYSVVHGHTHRQAIVHKTAYDIDGTSRVLAAVETGCMCKVEKGLGYTPLPDWQNGFATASIWPDGTFKLEVATYTDGTLFYRDQRFT
jgi:hypothetical protein